MKIKINSALGGKPYMVIGVFPRFLVLGISDTLLIGG